VKVYDYNGIPGNNFQVFYKEQRPDFVMPQTPIQALWGRDDFVIGSPEAGLTNQQNFDKYGIATFGTVSPTTDDTTRPEIFGYTSPILTPTTPRVVFVTPWHGAGLAAADPVRIRYTVNGQMPSNAKV